MHIFVDVDCFRLFVCKCFLKKVGIPTLLHMTLAEAGAPKSHQDTGCAGSCCTDIAVDRLGSLVCGHRLPLDQEKARVAFKAALKA